jgi:hypothetical protein
MTVLCRRDRDCSGTPTGIAASYFIPLVSYVWFDIINTSMHQREIHIMDSRLHVTAKFSSTLQQVR